MTARDPALANAVARAVDLDPALPISSPTPRSRGQPAISASAVFEGTDRTYQDDGTSPRSLPDAMIEDVDQAIAQVKRMVKDGVVRSLSGKDVPIAADTLCIHGDQPRRRAIRKPDPHRPGGGRGHRGQDHLTKRSTGHTPFPGRRKPRPPQGKTRMYSVLATLSPAPSRGKRPFLALALASPSRSRAPARRPRLKAARCAPSSSPSRPFY